MKIGKSILSKNILLISSLFSFFLSNGSYADFVNGGFESSYSPSSADTFNPIEGWTLTGYRFTGVTTFPGFPSNMEQLGLSLDPTPNPLTPALTGTPGGITDIVFSSITQSLYDYYLLGATPTPTLKLPGSGMQSVMINFRSVNAPLTQSGANSDTEFNRIPNQATAISQKITLSSLDIDPDDYKIHIRFKAAPVLENPTHPPSQQPFFAVQVNNITTGNEGSTPLFFTYHYAGQAGVPWKSITGAGTNAGSDLDYLYTDWQAFDIAPGNAFLKPGDEIELVVIASGCSANAHDGHVYLDDVSTSVPSGLWIDAETAELTIPDVVMTYTYTYKNKTTLPINNVKVIAKMPQLSDTLENTEFVSVTNPTTGEGSLCESTSATEVTCSLGTLQPEEIGTFRMAVKVPATASATAKVNNGTYTIEGVNAEGENAEKVLGPLVQTDVTDEVSSVSNLVVNVNGLPTNGTIGVSYQGTFTCTNTPTASATGDASGASCEIANLPAGLSLGSCTLSPGNSAWVEPAIIPINQTVTCSVTGIPTSAGTVSALASTNGANNSNSLSNKATATIAITSPSSSSSHLVVGVNNLPTTTTVGTSYDGTFTCSNVSTATAAASNASCAISNLPTGLSLNGCTISPTNAVWSQPASIPVNQTVTCSVSGTSTTAAIFTALASTNASNNENTTTNHANVTIVVSSSTDLVIPATLNGSPVIDSSVICCGRPVILGDLPLPGNAPTTYVITNKTGNVTCKIGKTRTQTYLKMNGIGSCTIVGTKNNVISAPLKLIAG